MGYTTPTAIGTDIAVGETVTAAKMNSHWSDNIRYLHGDDGAIALVNTLQATAGAANQNIILGLSGNSANFAGISAGRTAGEIHMAVAAAGAQFFTGSVAGDMILKLDDTSKKILIGSGIPVSIVSTATNALFGIGTTAPQGGFHAIGSTTGNVAQGGVLLLEAAAVGAGLQTLTSAGVVTRGALLIIVDRNNNGGAVTGVYGAVAGLGVTTNSNNSDTCAVVITAGGAITVQRTATGGTSGTHDLTIFAIIL